MADEGRWAWRSAIDSLSSGDVESAGRELGDDAARRESRLSMVTKVPGMWEPGESFDGYVIESVIGQGGMGFVYKARQTGLDRHVAIKTLLPQHLDKAEYLARFLREGRAATRIKSRHVVQIFDVRQRDGAPYLVMEFLSGVPLDAQLSKGGAMAPAAAVDVMLAVCDAVSAAHRVGVIHRDLKPANVFLSQGEDGGLEPKVVDFGISRLLDNFQDGLQTKTHALLGTPAYLSPEQTRGSKHITERSDQYALGLILYECLTGKVAFPDTDFFVLIARIATGEVMPPRTLRHDLSLELEAVVLRAMACEPDGRFESVAAFANALLPFASEQGRSRWSSAFAGGLVETLPTPAAGEASVRPSGHELVAAPYEPRPVPRSTISGSATELPRPSKRRSGSRWAVAAGAAGVLLLLGAGVASMRRSERPAATAADFEVSIRTVPATAEVNIDGHAAGVGRFVGRFPRDGAYHRLTVTAPGWEPQQIGFVGAMPEQEIRLTRAVTASAETAPAPAPAAPVAAPTVPPPAPTAPPPAPVALPAAPDVEPEAPGAERGQHGRHHRSRRDRDSVPAAGRPASTTAPEPSSGSNGATIL